VDIMIRRDRQPVIANGTRKALRMVLASAVALAMAVALVWLVPASADPPSVPAANAWTTNGSVHAVARSNRGTLYVGGSFSYVGPHTGTGAALQTGTSASLLPGPVADSTIQAVAPDGAGGWFIGGDFLNVGGQARSRLAHILPNGSVDPAWNPGANSTVRRLVVSGSTVYAAGSFSMIGGQGRSGLASLDATTGAASAWNPVPSGTVNALAVSGSTVYVGGTFTSIGGQARRYLAAVDATTGAATAWDPSPSSTVSALALSGSTVYAGGSFTTIGGQPRSYVAAVDAATGAATAWNPSANGGVVALTVVGSTVYAAGSFSNIGGESRDGIAALNSAGVATAWNPDAYGSVTSIAVSGSTVYASGSFSAIGGASRTGIAALDAGGRATSWDPNPATSPMAMAVQGSAVYIGGSFTSVTGKKRANLAEIDLATGKATDWDPSPNGRVRALTVVGSTVYAGGDFSTIAGDPHLHLAAVDAEGLAKPWNLDTNNWVYALASSGSTVYAGGLFTSMAGSTRNYLGAVDDSGTLTAWNPSANSHVYALAATSSTVYAGGQFTQVGGSSHPYVAAITTFGSGGPLSWSPPALNGSVRALAVDATNVYLGGTFTTLGTTVRNRIASVAQAGAALTAWDPNASATVYALALSGSTVYAGGMFTTIGGQPRNRIAMLEPSGLATVWNPGANNIVNALIATGNTVYAGGDFTTMGGSMGSAALFVAPPLAGAAPVLSGTFQVGHTVRTTTGAWSHDPAKFTYQWLRDGVVIAGATNASYEIAELDAGRAISAKVTAASLGGSTSSTSLTSQVGPGSAPSDGWTTDGSVSAVAATSRNTVYVAGNFTYVGPVTGSGVSAAYSSSPAPFTGVSGPAPVNGPVHAAVADGAGGWYIGGDFTGVRGVSRMRLAHVLSSGLVDPGWNPQVNGRVSSLAFKNGVLYVGGTFTTVGGAARCNLAAVYASGGTVAPWNPCTDGAVNSLLTDPSSAALYVGGGFSSVGGTPRSRLAAVDVNTAQLLPWSPNAAGGDVNALALSGTNVYVGGSFTTIGGLGIPRAAVVSTSGQIGSWTPNPNAPVYAIAATPATVYLGGAFTTVGGGTPRNRLAAWDSTGLLTPWDPNADSTVMALAITGTTVTAGGSFTSIGGQPRNRVAALSTSAGGAPTAWDPNVGNAVRTLSMSGNNVYIGGDFTTAGGQTRLGLAEIDLATGQPTAWQPTTNGPVDRLAASSAGVYVAGAFTVAGGQSRTHLAELNSSTGAATAFNPSPNDTVSALMLSGSTLYVGGRFTSIGGQPRNRIAALAAAGTATAWNPDANNHVTGLAITNGTIYAAGAFTAIGGQPRTRAAGLDSAGLATAFNPNPNDTVNAIAALGSTIYLGGNFTFAGGLPRQYAAAVLSDAGNASSWNPSPNAPVTALRTTGTTVYLGGHFTAIGGQARSMAAGVHYQSGGVTAWDPNLSINFPVRQITSTGSTVIVGGDFYASWTAPRRGLAVFANGPGSRTAPVLSGRSNVGETLTTSTGTWSNTPTSYSYQWKRGSTIIPNASGSSYTLTAADVGYVVTAVVTAVSRTGSTAATSDARTVVGAPVNDALPTVSPIGTVPGAYGFNEGTWRAYPAAVYPSRRRWERCEADGTACAAFSPAQTLTSLITSAADAGKTIRVCVTQENAEGSTTACSAVSARITGPPLSVKAPALSGTEQLGSILSGTDGTWTAWPALSTALARAWERCDASGANCVAFSPAQVTASLSLTATHVGLTVRFCVTAQNSAGTTRKCSLPSERIAGPPQNDAVPTVSGLPRDGQTLTGADGQWRATPAAADPPVRFWDRCDSTGNNCLAITGATATQLTIGPADVGKRIRYCVKKENSLGAATFCSASTASVAASYSDRVLADNPWLYWQLEDSATHPGAPVADSSGKGNPGIYVPEYANPQTPVPMSTGHYGQGMLVNKSHRASRGNMEDGHLAFPAAPGSFTAEMWFKAESGYVETQLFLLGPYMQPFSQDGGSDFLAQMTLRQGALKLYSTSDTGSTWVTITGAPVSSGGWHHLALTRDAVINRMRVYLDGKNVHERVINWTTPSYTRDFIALGNHANLQASNMVVDDFAVYEHALTAERVEAHAFGDDRANPVLTLTGGLTTPYATGRDLRMTATDPPGGSGINEFQLWIDPDADPSVAERDYYHDACTQLPCPATATAPDFLLPADLADGPHDILVRVADAAGNKTEKIVHVRVVNLRPPGRGQLGLEQWFDYDAVDAGGDSAVLVNADTGNAVWHSTPVVNPGRGLSTVVNLTYNSADRGGFFGQELGAQIIRDVSGSNVASDLVGTAYGVAGKGVSIGISGPTRVNEPLVGVVGAAAREELPLSTDPAIPGYPLEIALTDADGTRHVFSKLNASSRWVAPAGLNMYLRRYRSGGTPAAPLADKWAMTRPDGITYFFDNLGYHRKTLDRNGNELTYVYDELDAVNGLACAAGDVVGVLNGAPGARRLCSRRLKLVRDPAGRELTVHYKSNATVSKNLNLPALSASATFHGVIGAGPGQIDRIVDHLNRVYRFKYDDDGYLVRFTEASGSDAERRTKLVYETPPTGVSAAFPSDRLLEKVIELRDNDKDGWIGDSEEYATTEVEFEARTGGFSVPGGFQAPRRALWVDTRGAGMHTYQYDESARSGACVANGFNNFRVTERLGTGRVASSCTYMDEFGRPTQTTPPVGGTTLAAWTPDNKVASVTRAAWTTDEARTEYTYETSANNTTGVLLEQKDYPEWPSAANARVTKAVYENQRRVHLSELGGDTSVNYVADLAKINPLQRPEKGTRFERDSFGNVLKQIDAKRFDGRAIDDPTPDPKARYVEFTYHPGNGLVKDVYDEMRNRTQFALADYHATGQPGRVTDPRGKNWRYFYDAVGRVKAASDPRAPSTGTGAATEPFTTTVTFDDLDRVISEKVPKLSGDSNRPAEEEAYVTRSWTYDRNGNVLTATDAESRTTSFTYTLMDRLSEQTAPGSQQGAETTRFAYDDADRLIATVEPKGAAGVTAATARATQEQECTDAATPPARVAHTTFMCLDDAGRPQAEVRHGVESTAFPRRITSFAHDLRGNVIGVTDPARNATRTTPAAIAAVSDANAVNDATLRRWQRTYNKLDEPTGESDRPTESGKFPTHEEFGYDEVGNLTTVTRHPRGEASTSLTKYFYDHRDQVTAQEHFPSTDPAKSLLTCIKRRQDERVIAETSPRGTAGDHAKCFNDDPATNYSLHTRTYAYDEAGNLTSRSIPVAANQYGGPTRDVLPQWKVSYVRDDVGNATTITDPRGRQYTNTYYDGGQLRSTQRPSRYGLQWPGGHDTPDPGERFGAGVSADLEIGAGGPVLTEVGDTSRNAGNSSATPDLPPGLGETDLGRVAAEALPDMLPDAGATSFQYDREMRLTEITAADGNVRNIRYDAAGRVRAKSWPFEHGTTDPDLGLQGTHKHVLHRYEYDLNGLLTKYVAGQAHLTDADASANTWTFGYDSYNQRTSEDAPGSGALNAPPSDKTRELTKLFYDRNGNPNSRIAPRSTLFGPSTGFVFDSRDRMTSERNPAGETWHYEYDDAGRRLLERSPRGGSVTNPLFETQFVYDDIDRVTDVKRRVNERLNLANGDASGNSCQHDLVTTYSYDADGNRIKVDAPGTLDTASCTSKRWIETTEYDGRGLPWRNATGSRRSVTEFDAAGNLRRVVDGKGLGADTFPTHHDTGLDDASNLDGATRNATVRHYDDEDLPTRVRLPHGGGTDKRYVQDFQRASTAANPMRRVLSVVSPYETSEATAPKTSYTYLLTGWIASVSDEKVVDPTSSSRVTSRKMTYEYDGRGAQTKWSMHDGSGSDGRVIRRSYWPNGLLRERLAQREGESDDAARRYTYAYNGNGSLTSMGDYKPGRDSAKPGRVTRITRDNAERPSLVLEDWSTGRDSRFLYDVDGNLTIRETDGVWSTSRLSGPERKATNFAYDSLGREITMTVDPPSGPNRITYSGWHPGGPLAERVKKSNGTRERWFYDAQEDLVERRRDPSGGDEVTHTYTYDENGNRTRDERGNHTFNARDQLTSWTRFNTHATKPQWKVTYTVDGDGKTLNREERRADATVAQERAFDYYGERLDAVTITERPVGSPAQITDTRYRYNTLGALQRVTATLRPTGGSAPAVDRSPLAESSCRNVPANTATQKTTAYCYDQMLRLEYMKGDGVDAPATVDYDGLDRRDRRVIVGTGAVRDYSYVGISEMLSREQGDDASIRSYDYHANGQRSGQTVATGETRNHREYSTNANGSVEGLEHATTGVIATGTDGDAYEYDPYGELETPESGLSVAAKENPFRFQGFYYDASTRTYDMNARHYRPESGRFLTPDTYGSASGDQALQSDPFTQNRYAFGSGNPVTNVEFDGHFSKDGGGYSPAALKAARRARAQRRQERVTGKPRSDGQGKSDAAQGYKQPVAGPPVPHQVKVKQTIEKVVKTAVVLALNWDTINAHIARDRCRENHGIPASDQSLTPCDIYVRDDDLGDVAKQVVPGLAKTGAEMLIGGAVGKVISFGASKIASFAGPKVAGTVTGVVGGVFGSRKPDLAKMVAREKSRRGISPGRNGAVFEVEVNGRLRHMVGFSERGKGHAERLIDRELERLSISPSSVRRIHSQLEPCDMPGGYCRGMISSKYPNAEVTYTYPYPAGKAGKSVRQQSVEAMRRAGGG
jgi:RHS repeat-associated protein